MLNFLVSAMTPTSWVMIALLAVMVVVLIVLPMFTNKRRNKAINDLHGSLRPGDVIKTVGGIVGTVISIEDISPVDKQMVIETGVGNNKTTLVFDVQAVYQVISKVNAPAPESAEVVAPVEAPIEPFAENEPVAAEDETVAAVDSDEEKSAAKK